MDKQLYVHITSWKCVDEKRLNKETEEKQYIAYIYGRLFENNKSICVIVKNFHPYFYVEIPLRIRPSEFKEQLMLIINNYIDYRIEKGMSGFDKSCYYPIIENECKFLKMKDIKGYHGNNQVRLMKVVFKNEITMKYASYCLRDPKQISRQIDQLKKEDKNISQKLKNLQIYDELNLDNNLKFCHTKKINPSGWIKINKYAQIPLKNRMSKMNVEIICNHDDLSNVDDDFDATYIPPIRLLSYDIECDSPKGNMPQCKVPNNIIIQIGATFRDFGTNHNLKYILTLKKCGKLNTPKAKFIECDNEAKLIIMWAKLVEKLDPDLLYGFNIHGFDDEYIAERAKRYKGVYSKLMSILSRSKVHPAEYKIKDLSSSGVGKNILKFLEITGRNTMDIMKEIQKNPQYKLRSYKLDDVSEYFLGERKNDLPPKEIFAKYKIGSPEDIAIIADYCIQDCELVHNLAEELTLITGTISMGRVCRVPLIYILMRGQGIRVLSFLGYELMCDIKNKPIIPCIFGSETSEIGGAIVLNPKKGIYNEFPVVVLDFNSLYPSIMIANNISLDTAILDDKYDVDSDLYNGADLGDDEFEIKNYYKKNVLNGQVNYTKENIKILKYNEDRSNMGFLPKISVKLLQARALLKAKMNKTKDTIDILTKIRSAIDNNTGAGRCKKIGCELENYVDDADDKLECDVEEINIIFANEKSKIDFRNLAKYRGNFDSFTKIKLTYNGDDTIVDIDINNFNNKLVALKRKFKVLEAEQLAYKVVGNSVYGQTGAPSSQIYCPKIAALITFLGQKYIKMSKEHVEENYDAECVYGDTDSIFIEFKLDSSITTKIGKLMEAKRLGIQVSDEINELINRKPMKIAYEKCIFPLILMGKKNYCGLWHEEDITISKYKIMGCAPKKRNYAPILSKIFDGTVNKILYSEDLDMSIKKALKYFYIAGCKLSEIYEKHPEQFVLTKNIKDTYKVPPAHKLLADRIKKRDPGNAPQSNDRMNICIINVDLDNCTPDMLTKPAKNRYNSTIKRGKEFEYKKDDILVGCCMETPEFVKENNLELDYEHYVLKQLCPIINIFRLEIPLEVISYIFYKILTKYIENPLYVRIKIQINKVTLQDNSIEERDNFKIDTMKSVKHIKYTIKKKWANYLDFVDGLDEDIINGLLIIEPENRLTVLRGTQKNDEFDIDLDEEIDVEYDE